MTQHAHIRNFALIAHIDHGKSTLADRLIETCGGLEKRDMKAQILDSMDIERERGITIKAQTVRLSYTSKEGVEYQLNIMDTPGHVDFAYEVSRSLAACEGSLLIVDSTQGVEAQTLANVYQAIERDHEILPVINKIDLPAAEPARIEEQIQEVIGLDTTHAISVSGKSGIGIEDLLEKIVTHLPAPTGDLSAPLQVLLVDSWYDAYLGIVILVRVFEGVLKKGQKIRLMAGKTVHTVDQVGIFTPKAVILEQLNPGEIGFITAGIKNITEAKVGDTITEEGRSCPAPLEGFRPSVPVVFCSLFPTDASLFEHLRDSLGKLALNDAGFHFEPENSTALGLGFRCGFLGLLHMEIIEERLEREFNLDLITTAPSVRYQLHLTKGDIQDLYNPTDMPDVTQIQMMEEPWIKATILVPDDYLGGILQLCHDHRGVQEDLTYAGTRAMCIYHFPLNEIIFDFYDRLKSVSRGYASFDYQMDGYREGDLVKMNILINGEIADALTLIVHREHAEMRGRALCERLKDLIPRQMYKVAIQAAIGGKIIARETVSALRKDVTAKCYGGDISRKRKLLEKQAKGKKRMRQFGNIEIPKSVFIDVLKTDQSQAFLPLAHFLNKPTYILEFSYFVSLAVNVPVIFRRKRKFLKQN